MSLIKTTTTLIIFCIFITTLAYSQTAEDYFNSGIAKHNLKDYKGAIQNFNKAIEIAPNFTEAYNSRGNAKNQLKDYSGAIQDYNKAIELNPNYAVAYFSRGIAKILSGQKNNGCLDLSKAGELGFALAYNAIRVHCNWLFLYNLVQNLYILILKSSLRMLNTILFVMRIYLDVNK